MAGGGGGGGGAKAPAARPSSASHGGSKEEPLLGWATRTLLLVLISVMAFSIRLFSVVKYESVIHEFDPYFNYRVTRFLTEKGAYRMWDWFDDKTWYPLGRVVGGTVYPGLILTAGLVHDALHWLGIPIHVQEVCVFTAPLFSAFCALATYGLVRECSKGEGAGLAAAVLISVVPSYISRSVAGSFDNEGVAIFALVFVFYTFVKAHNTGRLSWTVASVAAYFYMVLSWGGYSFVINLIPIYALACVATGRMSGRLYGAFAPLVSAGTLLACSIPVVGFNAVFMSEHFGAFLAFGAVHVALAVQWIRRLLPAREFERAKRLVALGALALLGAAGAGVAAFVAGSPTLGWTGRSLSLLDPTYASKYIPIIASVSEHQPPTWSSYVTDLHAAALLAPLGLVVCFRDLTDGALFLVLYGVTSVYFSGVMVRLMLVLAPAACCLSGVALSTLLGGFAASLRHRFGDLAGLLGGGDEGGVGGGEAGEEGQEAAAAAATEAAPPSSASKQDQQQRGGKSGGKTAGGKGGKAGGGGKRSGGGGHDNDDDDDDQGGGSGGLLSSSSSSSPDPRRLPVPAAALGTALVTYLLWRYAVHCIGVSADMYSAPSIVLQTARPDGTLHVFDDFREAYAWLRHNTPDNAKVASWWDYGYQTTAMANRTVIVDNNTWNNTHIATVGRAMASPELKGWRIFRSLDVDYVFVVFGGLIGYPSDDINKFLWMVRIGGGVFPEIKEPDYLDKQGSYRVDSGAAPALVKSVMYKLSYYDFAPASRTMMGGMVMDRVRQTGIATEDIRLRHFEEAFTSQHWMMRVYKVLPPQQVERPQGVTARRAARQKRAVAGGKAASA